MSWNGEAGLLPFFLEPDERTLEKVGYKHAVGCLLSRHCFTCGKIVATANPFTMTRVCEQCCEKNQDSYAISKSKAKEAFLLGERDLKNLISVSHEVPLIIQRGDNTGTSVMYLMNDVMEPSFAKFGGAQGLVREFETRTEKALLKYNTSQRTAKPQKKRPKVNTFYKGYM